MKPTFEKELENLINCHSIDNKYNTPDFILTDYIIECLKIFGKSVSWREKLEDRTKNL